MKILLTIAWRNIWRNRQRSLVMIIAIMAGLWGGIFASALSFGLMKQRFVSGIEQHVSHVQIHPPEYLVEQEVKYAVDDWESLRSQLSETEEVVAFSGRTLVSGMLSAATLTTGVSIIGIDPEMEAGTTSLNKYIMEGALPDSQQRNPVLIGKKLADKIKAQINSRIVLTFQDLEGEITAASFRVAGIYQTSNLALDERRVFVRHRDINQLLGSSLLINEIGILLDDHELSESFAEKYRVLYPGLTIRTWSEVSPELGYIHEMTSVMLMFVLAIILLALAFGLLNTMLMSVFERVKELGMLMAIGMNKKRIFIMILFETTFLTLLGAIFGTVAGTSTILLFNRKGMDMSAVGGDSLNEFGFDSVVYPQLEASFFGMLTLLVVITAILTAIYPAYKALRLRPAEAVGEH